MTETCSPVAGGEISIGLILTTTTAATNCAGSRDSAGAGGKKSGCFEAMGGWLHVTH